MVINENKNCHCERQCGNLIAKWQSKNLEGDSIVSPVIPAEAGIQYNKLVFFEGCLDSRLHGNDVMLIKDGKQ